MDITHSSVPAPPKPPSIYFGGCCFGAAYYVGVHKAMCEIWGNDYYKSTLLSGGSAGTIFAIAIALGKSPEYLDDMYRRVSAKATRDGPVYYASKYMVDALYEILEDPQAYKKLEGRCIFGSTHFFAQHIWHSSWTSNEDVVRCVQASIHVPFYCMRMEPLKGSYPVDGAYGFSGIDLPHGDDTLYVGFDPHAEIACHLSNAEMFYPIVGDLYDRLVTDGYDSTKSWNGEMLPKVGFRQPNYPALCMLWIVRVFEIIFYYIYDMLCKKGKS